MAAPYAEAAAPEALLPDSLAECLRARATSSLRLLPCGTGMPFLSSHSLIWLSFQESRSWLEREEVAALAEEEAELYCSLACWAAT